MKLKNDRNYNYQSRNIHFQNILEKSYYVELGSIDMKVMNRFLKGEKISLQEIVDLKLLSEGLGAITSDYENDLYYQLNYLINLRLKNSTFKFILTAGSVKHYDEHNCEKYAPLVLIPFDYDYNHYEIVKTAPACINPFILKYISTVTTKREENNKDESLEKMKNLEKMALKRKKLNKKKNEEKKKITDDLANRRLNTIGDIDKLGLEVAKIIDTTVDPSNYLTIAFVEYPDITLNNIQMTVQKSVYEMTEHQLAEKYFKEIKGILPSNADQKYVCLKANNGENFSVDGRLGSGKTYAIINIIADQISKGKKILYANHDLDNIFDLLKNLTYLGLNGYVYNLTQNIREIENVDFVFEKSIEEEQNSEVLNHLFETIEKYQQRVHGYPVSDILEGLATLKYTNPNIEKIKLEMILERHEVKDIYSKLLSIEESLKLIDLYANNIWHRLHVSQNNASKEEIIKRVMDLQECNNEFYNILKKFVKKYDLVLPKSYNDYRSLCTDILCFKTIRPLPIWNSENIRDLASNHLREIQKFVDINYSLKAYYRENIAKTYQRGRMKKILEEICGNHININNSTDTIFVNRLIDFNDNLTVFANRIEKTIEIILQVIKELKDLFMIKNIDDEACEFFKGMNHFLVNKKLNHQIIDTFLEQTSIFSKNGEIIVNEYQIYQELKVYLPKYVNKFELITTAVLDNIFNRKNINGALSKLVNKKIARKEHQETKEIVEKLKAYHQSMSKVQTNLKELFGNNEYDIDFVNQFRDFYLYLNSLSTKQSNCFKIFMKKYQGAHYQKNYFEFVEHLLDTFKEEGYNIDSICITLKNYNIQIDTTDLLAKVEQLKTWNAYIKKVDKLKKEVRTTFIKDKEVDFEDVQSLIENDQKYFELHKKLDAKSHTYITSLGKYYTGLDTSINDVYQTIKHYEDFLKYANESCDVDNLFTDDVFSNLHKDNEEVNFISIQWNRYLKDFSLCFKSGQNELHDTSFELNMKLFRQFVEKKEQIEPILNINDLTESFIKYNLKDLHDGIRSCKYGIGISKRFMYTILSQYFDEIVATKPEILDKASVSEYLEQYIQYEREYCKRNIVELIENLKNINQFDTKSYASDFNDYNMMVNSFINSKSVFLTDLDIFNSDFDLSKFDMVIIDDAHLSTANKYHRIVEAKQVVVFGDVLFQTSVSNALMKRLGKSCTIHFRRRYVQMNGIFHNEWSNRNQYIYSYDNRCNIHTLENFDQFTKEILTKYEKNPKRILNVVVASEETRRDVYTEIVKKLSSTFNANEISNILSYNIRILNALTEGNRYVNDVFIYYDDIKNLEQSDQELIFKNFISAYNSVGIYFVKNQYAAVNEEIVKTIKKLIGRKAIREKTTSGITSILIHELEEKGLKIDPGFGMIDFVIRFDKPLAIILLGKSGDRIGESVDDYLFYHHEYEKHNWAVKTIFILDLYKDFNGVVKSIVNMGNKGK